MTLTTIAVPLPQNAYEIALAPGLIDRLGPELAHRAGLQPGKVLLVSNQQIFRHWGDRALTSLRDAGFDVATCLLAAGERYKTLRAVEKIYEAALTHRLERGSAMVALGGGIVGDLTGFAAATWLRGIAVVQVPTSLLAMVDAAIGGKTGANLPKGKNLIGAFHQPRWVAIDPEVLATLPRRELRAGMAEVVKYGVIWDAELFAHLEAAPRLDRWGDLQPLLGDILRRSCQAKADVVSQDEKEAGLRAILNYGHTIGHAIEALSHYRGPNHGEAVAIGMVAAAELAREMGWWGQDNCDRQTALLVKAQLPTRIPAGIDPAAIISALQLDKKVHAGRVRFILPEAIGRVKITEEVSPDLLLRVLERLQAS